MDIFLLQSFPAVDGSKLLVDALHTDKSDYISESAPNISVIQNRASSLPSETGWEVFSDRGRPFCQRCPDFLPLHPKHCLHRWQVSNCDGDTAQVDNKGFPWEKNKRFPVINLGLLSATQSICEELLLKTGNNVKLLWRLIRMFVVLSCVYLILLKSLFSILCNFPSWWDLLFLLAIQGFVWNCIILSK